MTTIRHLYVIPCHSADEHVIASGAKWRLPSTETPVAEYNAMFIGCGDTKRAQQANLPACSPHCPFNAERHAGKL